MFLDVHLSAIISDMSIDFVREWSLLLRSQFFALNFDFFEN